MGYGTGFFVLSPHLWPVFSSRFFADAGDGLQNVWNLWWVDHAVRVLHQTPWRTTMLHYPFGTTLLGHTLNPFNGFLAIGLLRLLSLVQAFNALVVFAFVATGFTAYLLCLEVSGSRWASWVGGALFTFSSYHFAHAQGHLQLVSLEWVPLFVLCWLRFLRQPTIPLALASAAVLFAVLLCDFYYFFYCVLAGLIIVSHEGRRRGRLLFLLDRQNVPALTAFLALVGCTSGLLTSALITKSLADPFYGAHLSQDFSMDLLAPFVPGWCSRFSSWTECLWRRWPGNGVESTVHVGWAVWSLAAWTAWGAGRPRASATGERAAPLALWYWIAGVFGILSLGLTLHVAGREVTVGPRFELFGESVGLPLLPYTLLYLVLPPLRLGGVPVRLMVMVHLALAVVAAAALQRLAVHATRGRRILLVCLLGWMALELLPCPIPTTPSATPGYVTFLRSAPGRGGVYDEASDPAHALYHQTSHGRPLAFGDVSRLPRSVARKDAILEGALNNGKYRQVCHTFGVKFLALPPGSRVPETNMPVTIGYRADDAWVFVLNGKDDCGDDASPWHRAWSRARMH